MDLDEHNGDSSPLTNVNKFEKCLDPNEKRRTAVGPWRNVAEFHKVYDWLFAPNYSAETRQLALSEIRIWQLRRSTQCPAAVLATAVIIDVQQKDHPESLYSAELLQTLYASALTRFFNFMSSIMQTHNMRTMYQTAKELGLEPFVVDMRHICAHGQVLPPLQALRNTAEYCIVWLHDYYWAVQRTAMCDVDGARLRRKNKTQFGDSVMALCDIFDDALEGHMKGAVNLKTLKRLMHGKRFHNLKAYMQQHQLETIHQIFDHVAKQLSALIKRDTAIKDMNEILVDALLRMRYFFEVAHSICKQTQLVSLLSATQSLFRLLAVYGFLEDFFKSLIEVAECELAEAERRKGACFWAVEIAKGFKAFRMCKQKYKEEMDKQTMPKDPPFSHSNVTQVSEVTKKLLKRCGVDMTRTLVLGDHHRRPWVWGFERSFLEERIESISEYSAPIVKSLMPLIVPPLSGQESAAFGEMIEECFMHSFATRKSQNEATSSQPDETIYTAEQLLQKLHASNGHSKSKDIEIREEIILKKAGHYGLWSEVEAHDWKSCAIGRTPWEL